MSCFAKSGFATAFFISALMRFTTGFGMPAGPSSPNHVVLLNPGSVSAIAGTSGQSLTRVGCPIAIALTRPAFTCGPVYGMPPKSACARPAITSTTAGPPPL